MKEPNVYLTPNCTIVYPALFEPSSYGKEEPTYSATFLIAKSIDLTPMREAVKAAATSKWGTQILQNMGKLHYPLRDGNEKAGDDVDSFYHGMHFIRGKSKWQPPIVNVYNDPIADPNELYGGCIVQAYFSFYGYDYMGKQGIGCGLRAVCKVEDGEPIGSGRVNTADVFQSVLQDRPSFADSPPGYEEEKIGGYGEMSDAFPNDKSNDHSDVPF